MAVVTVAEVTAWKRQHNDTSSESVKSEDDIDPGYNVTPDGELDSSYDVEPSVVGMLKDMLFTTAKAAEADDEKLQ